MGKNYKVIKDGERYTIGEWDDGYKAYEGYEWLGQHGYGNDTINADEIDDMDPEMVELYRLFGAVDYSGQ
jgi:hypothetical protein